MCNFSSLALTVQKLLARLKFKLQGQSHRTKNIGSHGKVLSQKCQSSSILCSKVISKVKVQTPRSKLQGQIFWCPRKGLVTRNIHVNIKDELWIDGMTDRTKTIYPPISGA